MSPRPISVSAPFVSRIVRESTCDATWNAMREGKFARLTLRREVLTAYLARLAAI